MMVHISLKITIFAVTNMNGRMKRSKYLLLLLLVSSCVTNRTVYRRSYQADIPSALPAPVQVHTPVVTEKEPEVSEPVTSARPLASQVRRFPQGTWQYEKQQALDSLCLSPIFEVSQLGLCVYDLTEGEPLYAVNAAHRMRPASCQKVVTAVTALHFLKGDYRLTTDFRIRGKVNGGVLEGDLVVVGGMDPLVTPAELLQAAASIRQQTGIESIAGNIVCDRSMREDAPYGWGWCWDDDYGPLSALLVDGKDCFEQEWTSALSRAGITVQNTLEATPPKVTATGSSVYTIRHDLDPLLEQMMKESNNIYAECLFYQTAATTGKKGAGHREAAGRTEELLKSLGLDAGTIKVADGSGLSLYNYLSAEVEVALLRYAYERVDIYDRLLPTLPVAGVDGTLKKRMKGTAAEGNVQAKTGTLTGVVTLAGYLTAANGHRLCFAIMNQGTLKAAAARAFQDKLCTIMCEP